MSEADHVLMATKKSIKLQPKRKDNGIYIDGIGLHQCGLPMITSYSSNSSIMMGDNNHSILVKDDIIEITTHMMTALSMYKQGFLGPDGRIHRIAVGKTEIGDGALVKVAVSDYGRYDKVILIFTRILPAAT
jgi:hypothetical protein